MTKSEIGNISYSYTNNSAAASGPEKKAPQYVISMIKNLFSGVFALLIACSSCAAQNSDHKKNDAWRDLKRTLGAQFNIDVKFEGNAAVYPLAVMVDVDKNTGEKGGVIIKLSDSIAHSFFPKIDSVLKIKDYRVFLDGKTRGKIVIPIVVTYGKFDVESAQMKVPFDKMAERLNNMFFYRKDDMEFYNYIFLPPMEFQVRSGY